MKRATAKADGSERHIARETVRMKVRESEKKEK